MDQLFRGIRRLEAWLISTAVLVVTALMIGNVACRTLLGFSLAFTEELSQFLIVLVTFVGLSYAAGLGRHIRMTAVYDQLNHKSRKTLMIVLAGSTGLLMLLLAWYSVRYVAIVHTLGTRSPVLNVPYSLVYSVAPLGFVLTAIQYGMTVAKNLVSEAVYLSYDHTDEYEPSTSGIS